ncbi:hypothetical protein FHX81_0969 [Saccharothrix saharensis]|uniref:CBM6 domain-containing protein n=1 Tax=Saccharothrix saharensis TaxID=571190 RepID=A0A543J783_9PSEU|nr:hypothetical protein [Saccharothrix saharensis]TQM78693.1 hypothetical protein FHX81_0969 [Saccharothrix saharensis]
MRVKPMIACVGLLAGAVVAVASSTARAATARYEAESSPAVRSGSTDSDWTGYTGSGSCNGTDSTGGYAEFTVTATAAGTATPGVRFANGATTARPATLAVNGSTVRSPSFEGTGTWSTWVTRTFSVPVAADAGSRSRPAGSSAGPRGRVARRAARRSP